MPNPNNEDIKWLYGKLKSKGYNIGSEQEFTSSLANDADRQWYYEKAKGMGLNIGSMDDFNSLYAPAKPQPTHHTQAQPAQPQQAAPVRQPVTYFRLRRGGKDFNVSADEVQKAGGLQAWANRHPGAPVRVYMQGNGFNGHVDLSQAHNRYAKQGYKYSTTTAKTPVKAMSRPEKQPTVKPAEQPMTDMQKEMLLDNLQGIVNNARSSNTRTIQQMKNKLEYDKKSRNGFLGGPVEGGVQYNPSTGKMEQTHLTPQGYKTTSKGDADMMSQQYREQQAFRQRMKVNGLKPDNKEDVQKQMQLDEEKPMRDVLNDVWGEAEAQDKKAQEAWRNRADKNARGFSLSDAAAASSSAGAVFAGRGEDFNNDLEYQKKRHAIFDFDKMANTMYARLPEDYRRGTLERYTDYFKKHPKDAKGKTAAVAAKDALMGDLYRQVYDRAKAQSMPKSRLDFLLRKIADQPLISSSMAANTVAAWQTGSHGLDLAEQDAMSVYGSRHKALNIAGTVANMALDPVTYAAGGVGGVVGKKALQAVGKQALKGATKKVAERYAAGTLAGRVAQGAAGGAANFGTFNTVKGIQQQMAVGGTLDENGKPTNELSAGDILKETAHGLMLGAATGTLSPLIGNVADKAVKATSSTAGKVALRAGQTALSTLAEGTVFAIPDMVDKGKWDWDTWTDSQAMMLGFKASHAIKSAPRVLDALRTDGKRYGLSFEERLRKQLDASPSDIGFKPEELDELRDKGYVDLSMLFSNANNKKNGKSTELDRRTDPYEDLAPDTFDGYEAMKQLMHDNSVSEATRAKAYYILTGHMLPMSTVTGYTQDNAVDGSVVINSVNARGGVVTTRRFANEQAAQQEKDNIMRQAELNSVTVGEKYKETASNMMVVEQAIKDVAPDADVATVLNNYKMVKNGQLTDEAYVKQAQAIDEAIERNRHIADPNRPEAIRENIKKETGIDVDTSLRKMPAKRTEKEQAVVDEYVRSLFPEQKRQENESGEQQPTADEAADADFNNRLEQRQQSYDEGRAAFDTADTEGDRSDSDAIMQRVKEAYEEIDRVFGDEAEMRLAQLEDDPWEVAQDDSLTEEQQDAVAYFINAKAAMDGLTDAANDNAENKRADIDRKVEQHTNKQTGMIHPATLKVDNRPVYIVSGNVAMFPDGSGVDKANSSESVVVCDAETGEVKFISPDMIYSVEEPISADQERQAAYNGIEAEQQVILGNDGPEQRPTEPGADNEINETNGVNGVNVEQTQKPAEKVQEPMPMRKDGEEDWQATTPERAHTGETPARAIDKIPSEQVTDKKGNTRTVHHWEQAPAEDTYDAMTQDVFDGDAKAADDYANGMAKRLDKEIKKLDKEIAKSTTGESLDDILEAKKRTQKLRDQREALQQRKKYWQNVRNVPVERNRAKAEDEARAAARAQAEAEANDLASVPEWGEDTPQAARDREFRRESDHKIERQKPLKATTGNEVDVRFSQKDVVKGKVAVVDASQLQASHVNRRRNPRYFLDEAQPKERTDEASLMASHRIAQDVRPAEITGSATAYSGAPVVNTRGEVIQGNNRTDALKRMYDEDQYKESAEKYKQYLMDHAEEFGLNPEDIAKMKHPVLVNMVDVSDEEAIRLGQMSAADTESGGVERIRPQQTRQKMDDRQMGVFLRILLNDGNDQTLSISELIANNGIEAVKYLHQIGAISDTQMESAVSNGALTDEAKTDIKNLLFETVFHGAPTTLREIFNSMPKAAQRAILATAWRDASSDAKNSMIGEIQKSIYAWNDMRTSFGEELKASKSKENTRLLVGNWMQQLIFNTATGQPERVTEKYSNFAIELATRYFTDKQTELQDMFNALFDQIQGTSDNLFDPEGSVPKSLGEAIKKVLGIDYKPLNKKSDVNRKRQTGSNGVDRNDKKSEGGQSGSAGDTEGGEQGPQGARAADSGRGTKEDATGRQPRDLAEAGNGTGQRSGSEEVSRRSDAGVRQSGQAGGLNEQDADAFLSKMEDNAVEIPNLELNPANWLKEFGEDGVVTTPIAEVKMGANQIAKLFEKGRSEQFGMIKPTLEHPLVIIEVPSNAVEGETERGTSWLFVKTFLDKNGEKIYYFKSVTVKKDGLEVSVSSHFERSKRIKDALIKGKLLYRFDGGAQTEHRPADVSVTASPESAQGNKRGVWRTPKDAAASSAEKQGLDYEQPNEAEAATKGSGITPQSTPSAGKDSEKSTSEQEKSEKVAESQPSKEQLPSTGPSQQPSRNAVRIVQVGDFYEVYGDDADVASKVLGITATKRTPKSLAVAGFPKHALDAYLPKLIRAGYSVDIEEGGKVVEHVIPGTTAEKTAARQPETAQEEGKAYKNFFDTLQEKTDEETGMKVLYEKASGAVEPVTEEEAELRDAVSDVLRNAGIEVIDDEKEGQRVLDMANGNSELKLMSVENAREIVKRINAITPEIVPDLKTDRATAFETYKALKPVVKDGATIEFYHGVFGKAWHGDDCLFGKIIPKLRKILENSVLAYSEEDNLAGKTRPDGTIHREHKNIDLYDNYVGKVKIGEKEYYVRITVQKSHKGGQGTHNFFVSDVSLYDNTAEDVHSTKNHLGMPPANGIVDAKLKQFFDYAKGKGEKISFLKAYHGSAADFDEFDTMNHLSEGEGSQVYGAGTYVTDHKGLGKKYAKIAQNYTRTYKGEPIDEDPTKLDPYRTAADIVKVYGNMKEARAWGKRLLNYAADEKTREFREKILDILEHSAAKDFSHQSFLYTVEIPDDNGKNYLDWDGRVDRYLDQFGISVKEYEENDMVSIGDAYLYLSRKLGSDKAASEMLSKAGYTGIKVHAARTSGDKRYQQNWNYVIFNDDDVKIGDKVKFFRTADGEVYGFTVGGKIYIDPRITKADTPIHEYAHLWAEALRMVNPKEWQNVVGLMKQCKDVWEQVKREYPELTTDDEIADEVLAHYSGKRGAERLRAEMRKAMDGEKSMIKKAGIARAFDALRDSIKRFWKHISEDIFHIHFTSAEEVADKVMYDLLNKVKPGAHDQLAEERAEIERRAKEDGTWMKAPNGKKSNLSEEQWVTVRTKQFKDWFGDWENDPEEASQAVDENGEPKVFYHNTDNDFTVFDANKNGTHTDAGWLGDGFYFYGDENEGNGYGHKKMGVFLNARNFYYASSEENEKLAEANNRDKSIAFRNEIEDEGYDAVYYNGDLRQEAVVFYPEQIKSATDNVGTFDETNPDIRYQFVGEKGAASADRAEEATTRLDNLSVARKMEEAGKDAHNIKMATGWERGADEKWRYEIPDFRNIDPRGNIDFFKNNPDYKRYFDLIAKSNKAYFFNGEFTKEEERELSALDRKLHGLEYQTFRNPDKLTLKDYMDAPELFKAYPQLRNLPVKIEALPDNTEGAYTYQDGAPVIKISKGIMDSALAGVTIPFKRVMAHEIQHAIQLEEGFAKGGSEEMSDYLRKNRALERRDDTELYASLAGEVEARNAARRVAMTDEQRRRNLASDTEDVSREDQIYLYDSFGIARSEEGMRKANVDEDSQNDDAEVKTSNDEGTKFRSVEDGPLLDFLNGQPTRKGFRYAQWANFGVLPPMTAKVDGEWRPPMIFSQWEQSEEGMRKANGKADLVQGNGRTTGDVAYNPYFHIRTSPLNDQFTAAYDRPELVVVEGEYPVSELTSGYHAPGAKNSVGLMDWHSGSVNGQLSDDTKVKTMLSRYFKPLRIVPWGEVADRIMERIGDQDITFPINAVPPMLRAELAKRGAKFGEISGQVKEEDIPMLEDLRKRINAGEWDAGLDKVQAYLDAYESSDEAKEARVEQISAELNTPIKVVKNPEEIASLPSRRKRMAKGWFEESTGEVVVMLPNNVNVADVDNTVVHEVVGHNGLRKLIGEERFNEFLDEVHEHAGGTVRKAIDKIEKRLVDNEVDRLTREKEAEPDRPNNRKGVFARAEATVEAEKKRQEFRREATEEYMADMAGRIGNEGFKKMDREQLTFWGRVKAKVQQFLDKFLRRLRIPKSIKLSDKDVAYILYKSWKNLRNGGKPTIVDEAEDAVMRSKTHYDEVEKEHFRDGDMGLEETISNMKAEVSKANADDFKAKTEAMKAIGGNLSKLRSAMARQREYDISTAKSMTDLAKVMIDNGLLDHLSEYEVKRVLGAIQGGVGKEDISKHVQKLMDIMVDNQLHSDANTLGHLFSMRGTKLNERGVEVQGNLDPEGQLLVKVARKYTSFPKEEIDNTLIPDLLDRMGSDDKTIADNAAIEYAGVQIARRYVEEITESKAEERSLRESVKKAKEDKDAGRMSDEAYKQYVQATADAIRQNKIERAESYADIADELGGRLSESTQRAKAWRDAETDRINEIHHNCNSDMQGRPTDEHHKDNKAQKFMNNSAVRFLLAPLGTFDQMLRMFGKKNISGEGYLWNRFMRGWVDASDKEYTGYRDALKELDAKASEVFGKKMKWADLFSIERKMDKVPVEFWDGGERKMHELSQGNLLYMYMVNKMADGQMKLRYMGVTDEDMDAITNMLDPRFKELADWMQDEFLVEKRNKYNEVHKRMFGAPMAAIENYFPLKILQNSLDKEEDVAKDDNADIVLPGTTTSGIIKRRRNNKPLDVTGADAFSVICDHLQEMEHWAAFAELTRDINTMLSYKRFRNQVMNMTSVYGAGHVLWKNFRNTAKMAVGAYRPPIAELDKSVVNIAKGVTAAKVSFRVFTALKQLLSYPAYFPDASAKYLIADTINPIKAWNWSIKNLPNFEKRWMSRMAGDPRLMKSDMDWKMWRNRIVEIASRIGMSPNAFIDALTVSIGAHSMYQTRYAKYKKWGFDDDTADNKARQDATILFNETQQSSEGPFLSTMQVDRSWLSTLFTVFRNSSMSYTRQEYDAFRNEVKLFTPGYRERALEYMAKQLRRQGLTAEQADKAARKELRNGPLHNLARIAVFGFALQLAWNLGAYLPYLLLGDDNEQKDDMLNDAMTHALFGSFEGLTGGDLISNAGNMAIQGDWNWAYLVKDMPAVSDLRDILQTWPKDNVEAINDCLNLLTQSAVGVNPQSVTDALVAILDYCGDDAQTSKECALLISRIINCPPSQIDKIYFDELGVDGVTASKMTPSQIAKRYARYKRMRQAPLTGWMYSDDERKTVEGKYSDKANKKAKETLDKMTDGSYHNELEKWREEYKQTAAKVKEINRLKSEDEDAADDALDKLEDTPEYMRYEVINDYKRDISGLTKEWLQASTPEERGDAAKAMLQLKQQLVNDLKDTK